MTSADLRLDTPPPELRFRRRLRIRQALSELRNSGTLIRTLAERDLRVRYKQAVLGFAWAIVAPLVLMLVFTLFFSRFVKVDTHGVPYPIFAYLGLIPWAFFSSSVSQGGSSILSNKSLLNKVYCPREVFPIAAVTVAAVDASMSLSVLALLFFAYRTVPGPQIVYLPLLLLVQLTFTLGITFVLSSVLVYFRDLLHAMPLLLQLGLFATPVAYGLDLIPTSLLGIYAFLDPLGPVIDGYRRTLLFGQPPDLMLMIVAAASASTWLVGGYILFKRLETRFADVA